MAERSISARTIVSISRVWGAGAAVAGNLAVTKAAGVATFTGLPPLGAASNAVAVTVP